MDTLVGSCLLFAVTQAPSTTMKPPTEGKSSLSVAANTANHIMSTSSVTDLLISSSTAPSNSTVGVTILFQFQAPYSLTELTDDLREKMVLAVAKALGVNPSEVVLSFDAVGRRRVLQQSGVLVSVGVRGSVAGISQISQEVLNSQMAAMGLKPVTVINTSTQQGVSLVNLLFVTFTFPVMSRYNLDLFVLSKQVLLLPLSTLEYL